MRSCPFFFPRGSGLPARPSHQRLELIQTARRCLSSKTPDSFDPGRSCPFSYHVGRASRPDPPINPANLPKPHAAASHQRRLTPLIQAGPELPLAPVTRGDALLCLGLLFWASAGRRRDWSGSTVKKRLFAAPGIAHDGVSATCIDCSRVSCCFFAWLLWARHNRKRNHGWARKDTDGEVLRRFCWRWAGCGMACEGDACELGVGRDWWRGTSVRQRRTSRSTGAVGDVSWESEVSGRRPVTLVVRRTQAWQTQ